MKTIWAGVRWSFSAAWALLDGTRRAILNLLLLALLVAAVWAVANSLPRPLQERTALVIDLKGALVEQFGGNRRQGFLAFAPGSAPTQVRLRDVLRALDAAARDAQITHLVLRVDDLGAAGLASLREVAAAIERVKAAGKPVLAYSDGYTQRGYFLAAHASEVYLHPMGQLSIEGFGGYRSYYKELFDKVGINVHVLRAGKYKNAAETFAASGPSPETTAADKLLYDTMWRLYTSAVEKARKAPVGAIDRGIERLPELLADADGNVAKMALQQHLVDKLMTQDEWRKLLIARGASDDQGKSFRQISMGPYLARQKQGGSGDAIAVVVAEGAILDGAVDAGRVGGQSTAALIRQAREDRAVKAVVLRVRSPGGSAFASEQLRHELALTRAAGKPVVVSMGDVAASGGYWIAMAADEVIADEATITGSIGVLGILPTAEKALAKVGVHTDGYTTTWLAGAYDQRRDIDPRFEKVVQLSIDHVYRDFLAKVASARDSTPEKINEVAQGRVWTGAQAKERGLVDRVGSYADALKAAAARAKLTTEARVVYFERERGRLDQLLGMLPSGVSASVLAWTAAGAGLPVLLQTAAPDAQDDLLWFAQAARLGQRGGVLAAAQAHCLCSVQP